MKSLTLPTCAIVFEQLVDGGATFCLADNEDFLNAIQLFDSVQHSSSSSLIRHYKLGTYRTGPFFYILFVSNSNDETSRYKPNKFFFLVDYLEIN